MTLNCTCGFGGFRGIRRTAASLAASTPSHNLAQCRAAAQNTAAPVSRAPVSRGRGILSRRTTRTTTSGIGAKPLAPSLGRCMGLNDRPIPISLSTCFVLNHSFSVMSMFCSTIRSTVVLLYQCSTIVLSHCPLYRCSTIVLNQTCLDFVPLTNEWMSSGRRSL